MGCTISSRGEIPGERKPVMMMMMMMIMDKFINNFQGNIIKQ
jgi:hypothetical protein